ncbi:hypothetical protein [Saccharothrix coeruleofusca]|uniref:PE family protein n=1 Tax=Saccharothrix coeruleofusca TaxID=33919 RepID=A0A918AVE6_9PSEU|nr:hypothetical protein [Saccharothrix coeruleofusca]GGP80630.1 hypothetical protein GCM10010185_63140 [Saccharothrix coeruleofusca]
MAEENGLLGAVAAAGGAIGRAVGEVFAAEKRLAEATSAGPGGGQKFEVSRDTVLQAAKIIQDQAGILSKKLNRAGRHLHVELSPGVDDVNQEIAAAWNSRLIGGEHTYTGRIEQYITSLDNLCNQLREVAKQYGFTEEEITASLGAKGA